MNTTDEVEKVTNEAMIQAGGKVSIAADLLKITKQQLKDRLRFNKNLKAAWWKEKKVVTAPSEAVTVNRESFDPPAEISDEELVLKSDEELAAALQREDASIRKGLESMGVKGDELNMAVALKDFAGKHFGTCLQLTGGGITKQFLQVMVQIQKIDERLEDRSGEFALTLPEEIMLREDRSRLLMIMSQFSDRVNSSALTQAKIWVMKNGKKNNKPDNRPKGFLKLAQ